MKSSTRSKPKKEKARLKASTDARTKKPRPATMLDAYAIIMADFLTEKKGA